MGAAKTIEFKGQNADSAFNILEGEKDVRRAELWSGEERLAEIVRNRSGVWQLDPGHEFQA